MNSKKHMKILNLKIKRRMNKIKICIVLFFLQCCTSIRNNRTEVNFIKQNIVGKSCFKSKKYTADFKQQFNKEYCRYSQIKSKLATLIQPIYCSSHGSFAVFYLKTKTGFNTIELPADSNVLQMKLDSLGFKKTSRIISKMNAIYKLDTLKNYLF